MYNAPLVDVNELAQMLHVTKRTIYRYRSGMRNTEILRGLPEPVQHRPFSLWLRSDIEKWLESKSTFKENDDTLARNVDTIEAPKRKRGRPRKQMA